MEAFTNSLVSLFASSSRATFVYQSNSSNLGWKRKREMKMVGVALLVVLLIAAQLPSGLALPSTSPAFLWSPYLKGFKNERIEEAVNYQTLSAKDLAKSVMSEGGWSNLLCSGKEPQQPLDIALLLVGRELQSLDISGNKHVDPGLVDLLKVSLTSSNFSLAFPYVAASEEKVAMESSLISEFAKTCGHDLDVSKVAFSESCSVESDDFGKLADIDSVYDYLISRMEKGPIGQANLIVYCEGNSRSAKAIDEPRSESQLFSELINSVEQSGAKYVVLYVSDPVRSTRYPSHQQLQRFLAEGTLRNGSANSTTCDGVCQIKSSLLEGALVGIVLLVILISGLCCMMGIDTPTRFETPQDS